MEKRKRTREEAITAAAKIYAHWLNSEEGQAARAKRNEKEEAMGKKAGIFEVTTVVRYQMGEVSWPDDGFDNVEDRMIRFLRESQSHTLYEAAGRKWIDGKFYIELTARPVSKVLLHKWEEYDDEKTWETFDGQTINPKGEVIRGDQD